MAEFKTRKLEFFKRLKPLGRIHLWNNTYKTHLRNRESHLEMLLENRAGEEQLMLLIELVQRSWLHSLKESERPL